MANYLDIVYSKKRKPHTNYPALMCRHLFDKFGMKEGQRLLDVGCGRGDFTKEFAQLGLQVAGIDREQGDPEFLGDIEIRTQQDLENDQFPYEDASFDIVFSKSVIEHIWNPDHFMKEQLRVLKPGGRLITLTPDWHSQMFIFYDDYTHVHPYTTTGIKDMFAIYGLKNEHAELFYQLPSVWKYPVTKIMYKGLQMLGPVKKVEKNKLYRWSRELMILASGVK